MRNRLLILKNFTTGFLLAGITIIFFSVIVPASVKAQMPIDRQAEVERLLQQGQQSTDPVMALSLLQQALAISQETGDRQHTIQALFIILSFQSLGRLSQVPQAYQHQYQQQLFELLQQDLETAHVQGNHQTEAQVSAQLGDIYLSIGQLQQAKRYYQQAIDNYQAALEMVQQTHDYSKEAELLTWLDNIYSKFSLIDAKQMSSWIAIEQQQLTLARKRGDRQAEAFVLNSLSTHYQQNGQYSQALTTAQQSLHLAQEIGDRRREAAALAQLGNIYFVLGQEQSAIDLRQQARKIRSELSGERNNRQPFGEGSSIDEVQILANRGADYLEQGNIQQSIETYQQALDRIRHSNVNALFSQTGEMSILLGLSRAYEAQKEYPQSIDALQQALQIERRHLSDRTLERVLLTQMGQLLEKQQQPELAILFFKQVINITEETRQDLRRSFPDFQQSYTETVSDVYRHLADLLLRQDRVLEAQQVLDLLKIQELEDYLKDARGNDQTAQGIEYLPSEQRILDLYNDAIAQGQELAQLLAIPTTQQTQAQQQRLVELTTNQQQLMQSFNAFIDSPELQSLVDQLSRNTQQENLALTQLNALRNNLRSLNQNAVLLYPLILDDRLELVLVTPYAPPIRRTVAVTREELNRTIVEFRQALTRAAIDTTRAPAQQLYQWLIEPIAADLQAAHAEIILYAPDGQLRYIPLSALNDGHQWLVERFRIDYITAASLADFSTPRQMPLRVLAGALSEGEFQFQIGTRQFSLSGLPFARQEIDQIAAEIPQTTELLNQAFTLQATVPQMDHYTIVHLATHAAFIPGRPEDSFILFGNGDRVTLRDIATWSLPNVDLVVLSACQTAIGGTLGNGEEILGFGYQMQRTGAKSVIASLWAVDDNETQTLMNAFYRTLKQPNLTKAEALRQAQISLIHQNSTMHPYYWAAFILIGNGL